MPGRFLSRANVPMKAPVGQAAVALGVAAFGAFVLYGSYNLPTGGGYAQVGPGVVPRIAGLALLAFGVLLLREAFTGGFRAFDEAGERERRMDWRAFAWISAAILAYGAVITSLGFVLASTILFCMVARAFGSRRWLGNAVAGAVVAGAIFAVFDYGLGLSLPAGVLGPLLR